jgi:hypothetical protein
VLLQLGRNLVGEVRSGIIHRPQDAQNCQGWVESHPNSPNGAEQVAQAFQSVVFALDGDEQ